MGKTVTARRRIDAIGLGVDLQPSATAAAVLAQAELVIGAERHLAAVDCGAAATLRYPSPLAPLAQALEQSPARRIAVLASGDALFFGIGSWLLRHCESAALHFHPNVTSVQAACARLALPWQTLRWLSLHGRPLRRLRAALCGGETLAILTDLDNTPSAIAHELIACGYRDSTLHLCEALGSPRERVRSFVASELATAAIDIDPLNLVIVQVRGTGGLLPAFPGIADDLFGQTGDSQFTKREVRLAALSRLALQPGETGWDIGAGSGGLAIEWARWNPRAQIYAIERDAARRQRFQENCARFGEHGNLQLIAAAAPAGLDPLPAPDAVYLGGSGGALATLLQECWSRLRPGGRLVAAAVTLESRAQLQTWTWPTPPEHVDIAISYARPLGGHSALRPQLPVLLSSAHKPVD